MSRITLKHSKIRYYSHFRLWFIPSHCIFATVRQPKFVHWIESTIKNKQEGLGNVAQKSLSSEALTPLKYKFSNFVVTSLTSLFDWIPTRYRFSPFILEYDTAGVAVKKTSMVEINCNTSTSKSLPLLDDQYHSNSIVCSLVTQLEIWPRSSTR